MLISRRILVLVFSLIFGEMSPTQAQRGCLLISPCPQGGIFLNARVFHEHVLGRIYSLPVSAPSCMILGIKLNIPKYHSVDFWSQTSPESLSGHHFVDFWNQDQNVSKSGLLAIVLSTSGIKPRMSPNR